MSRRLDRLEALCSRWVTVQPGRLLGGALLLLVLLAWPLAHLTVGNDLEGWLDPAELTVYRAFQADFGREESHLFAFRLADLPKPVPDSSLEPPETFLDRYLEWVAQTRRRDGVAALLDPVGVWYQSAGIGAWTELDFKDPAAMAAARERFVAGQPAAWGSLVGRRLETMGLLLVLEAGPGHDPIGLLGALRAEFAALGVPFHEAGAARFSEALAELLVQDLTRVTTLLAVTAGVLLLAFFRSPAVLAAVLFGIGVSTALALGLCVAGGVRLNLLTLILFPLVFSMALNIAIHLFSRRADGEWRLAEAMGRVWQPALLAAITSAVGAGAFVLAPQPVLREMGVVLPLAVLITFVSALLVTPAAYQLLSGGRPPPPLHLPPLGYISPGSPVWRRRVSLLLLAGGVAAVGVAPGLKVNPDAIFFFPQDSPLLQDYRFIEEELTGLLTAEGYVRAAPGQRLDLDLVARFAQAAAGVAGVSAVVTALDFPPGVERGRYLNPDRQSARLTLRLRNLAGRRYADMADELQRTWAGMAAGSGAILDMTGQLPLILSGQARLLTAQAGGFLGVLVTVAGVLYLAMRNWRILALAVAVNALPLVLMGGAMVWLGIEVNSVNLFVAAVMLGVVVDDTIHLLHCLDERGDLATALREVGPSLWITAVVLTLSFVTLLASRLQPVVEFGVLATVALVTAHLCEVFLLPWLVGKRG